MILWDTLNRISKQSIVDFTMRSNYAHCLLLHEFAWLYGKVRLIVSSRKHNNVQYLSVLIITHRCVLLPYIQSYLTIIIIINISNVYLNFNLLTLYIRYVDTFNFQRIKFQFYNVHNDIYYNRIGITAILIYRQKTTYFEWSHIGMY